MLVYLQLYWAFCKIGFTSFGGLSMIPLIESEMTAHAWMALEELSDIVAIAEMTPGPLGLNCATFAGVRAGGMLGALCASLGVLTPTVIICSVVALAFHRFKEAAAVQHLLQAVRPACLGIIAGFLINLLRSDYLVNGHLSPALIAIGVAALVLLLRFRFTAPKTVIVSAAAGLLLLYVPTLFRAAH